jgi:hypothetical protein
MKSAARIARAAPIFGIAGVPPAAAGTAAFPKSA